MLCFQHYAVAAWYMIAVSQIDVPALAAQSDLERIADEFLRQQGQRDFNDRGDDPPQYCTFSGVCAGFAAGFRTALAREY